MRVSIEHRTRYGFPQPRPRLVQMLRMRPSDTALQSIAEWRIDVDCDARLRRGQDGFGNAIKMLYAQGPVASIDITVTGEVITTDDGGAQAGLYEPFPPVFFMRATGLTATTDEIAALAMTVAPGGAVADRLGALCALLAGRFEIDPGRPVREQTAAQALAGAPVTARDLAHLFIACAHAMAVPARFISGYSMAVSARPTPHVWAEGFVDGLGWVGFDPAIGTRVGEGHVRVAMALDAAGAAPVAGFRLGDGENIA